MPTKEHRGAMAAGGAQIIPWPSSSQAHHGSHQPITGSLPQAQRSRGPRAGKNTNYGLRGRDSQGCQRALVSGCQRL